MKNILYILLLLPVIGNAQIKIFGNAVNIFQKTGAFVVVDTLGDTTLKHNSDGSFTSITNDASGRNGIHWDGVNNRTGINTKTPKATLTVSNNDTIPNSIGRFQVVNNNGGNAVIDLMGFGAPAMFIGRRSNGTAGTPTATDSGNVLAGFYGRGYGATGYFTNNRGGIEVVAAETHTNTNQGTYINFNVTGKSGGSYLSKMRLYDNGHLVIADVPTDTGDNFRLQVDGNAMVNDDLEVGVNIRTTRIFVKTPTVATELDSIVVKQNGEYVPALARTVMGGKVDSITKSNDTFYYWKLGVKYFAGLDATAGGGGGEANTASNLGGGLANYDGKSGVDLRFNSFSSSDFDLASNLFTIDATLKSNWNTAYGWGDHAAAGYALSSGLGAVATSNDYGDLDNIPSTFTPSAHTHAQSDITGLTTDLADKLTIAKYIVRETPSGSVNSSNTTYTLANTPVAGTEMVYLNGMLQEPGAGNDYTISGATITYLSAPVTGDKIRVTYISQ